jgi:hypothetical protein
MASSRCACGQKSAWLSGSRGARIEVQALARPHVYPTPGRAVRRVILRDSSDDRGTRFEAAQNEEEGTCGSPATTLAQESASSSAAESDPTNGLRGRTRPRQNPNRRVSPVSSANAASADPAPFSRYRSRESIARHRPSRTVSTLLQGKGEPGPKQDQLRSDCPRFEGNPEQRFFHRLASWD